MLRALFIQHLMYIVSKVLATAAKSKRANLIDFPMLLKHNIRNTGTQQRKL